MGRFSRRKGLLGRKREDEPVSNDDMEHSVIVVASGFRTSKRHPIVDITMIYRLVITFH
jgi:hypothetical protein